jgi:hypothetical protein
MNWEAIGAIGEVIGALGVIVSLLYLAVQIRQNTASVKASSYDSWLSQAAGVSDLLLSNEALGRAWARGLSKPDSLDPIDRERFDALMTRFLRLVEFAHSKVANGLMELICSTFGGSISVGLQRSQAPACGGRPIDSTTPPTSARSRTASSESPRASPDPTIISPGPV